MNWKNERKMKEISDQVMAAQYQKKSGILKRNITVIPKLSRDKLTNGNVSFKFLTLYLFFSGVHAQCRIIGVHFNFFPQATKNLIIKLKVFHYKEKNCILASLE